MFDLNQTFSSTEVIALAGVTQRQLQWWDERGVVSPEHRGHARRYQLEDLIEVSVIAELRHRGFSLQKIRRVLRGLHRELGRRLADVVRPASDCHLLTDGRNIFLEDSQRKIVNLLKNSQQPLIAVCISDHVKRLQAAFERAGSKPAPTRASNSEQTAPAARPAKLAGTQAWIGRPTGRTRNSEHNAGSARQNREACKIAGSAGTRPFPPRFES